MGLNAIIKPLFPVLSSAINKSQQHQEKNSWECQESNPGLLGENQVCFLCTITCMTFVPRAASPFATSSLTLPPARLTTSWPRSMWGRRITPESLLLWVDQVQVYMFVEITSGSAVLIGLWWRTENVKVDVYGDMRQKSLSTFIFYTHTHSRNCKKTRAY